MNVLTITLAIIVPLGIAALTTWINIRIKFAKDVAHAIREVRSIFSKLIFSAMYLYNAGSLIFFFAVPVPLNRLVLAGILVNCFSIFQAYMMWWIRQLLENDLRLADRSP